MKDEFSKYLDSIEAPQVVRGRVDQIHGFYQILCPEEITDLYISEYVEDSGRRQYESLWFFSSSYCMEALQFVSQVKLDMIGLHDSVYRWAATAAEYDFKKATSASRLSLDIEFGGDLRGSLKASSENCDFLVGVLRQHLIPNMKQMGPQVGEE